MNLENKRELIYLATHKQKKELEKRGIWSKLNSLDPDELQQQLEGLAFERKKGEMNIERIVEVVGVDEIDVKAKRSAGFRRELDLITKNRADRSSNSSN